MPDLAQPVLEVSCRAVPAVSEITLTGGERIRVQGSTDEVEARILASARGSIMELAWMIEVDSGRRIGINPEHVIALRDTDDR